MLILKKEAVKQCLQIKNLERMKSTSFESIKQSHISHDTSRFLSKECHVDTVSNVLHFYFENRIFLNKTDICHSIEILCNVLHSVFERI